MRFLVFIFLLSLLGGAYYQEKYSSQFDPNNSKGRLHWGLKKNSHYSPYDTLQQHPLILLDKFKNKLLRQTKNDSLKDVLPSKEVVLTQSKLLKHKIQSIELVKKRLVIWTKGAIVEHPSDTIIQLIKAYQPNLISLIEEYGTFEYNIRQVYKWDPKKGFYYSEHQKININLDKLCPKPIHYNFYSQNDSFQWKGSFDTLAIFQQIIPGHFVESKPYGEKINAIFWRCDSCPVNQEFYNYFDSLPTTFPYQKVVQSRLKQVFSYKNEEGKPQKLLYFTSSNNPDYESTYRFDKGYMGLALFEQHDSIWQLKYFNPTINMLGMYGESPLLEMIAVGSGQMVFVTEDILGSKASVHYGQTYIYSFLDGDFKKILQLPLSSRDYTLSAWQSSFSCNEQQGNFSDLTSLVRGSIHSADFSGQNRPPIQLFSPKLAQELRSLQSFNFTILQTYQWNKKKKTYYLKEEKLKAHYSFL